MPEPTFEQDGFLLVPVSAPRKADIEAVATSPNRAWTALVVREWTGKSRKTFHTALYLKRQSDAAVFVVTGPPDDLGADNNIVVPWRPIDGLVWENARRLRFDQWMQPHHAVRTWLDVENRRVVGSTVFNEEHPPEPFPNNLK